MTCHIDLFSLFVYKLLIDLLLQIQKDVLSFTNIKILLNQNLYMKKKDFVKSNFQMNFHIKESQFLYWTILLDRFAKIKATYMTWPNQKNANWPRLLNVCYKLINDAMLYGRFPLYLI